jgi:two-component system response regulator NreC
MSGLQASSTRSDASGAVPAATEIGIGDVSGITVVLADDHPVVRRGLRMLLEEAGLRVVAEAADTRETGRKVLGYKPTVLILDLGMPDGSSLEAIPGLLERSPSTAIVVLTMHDEPELARGALRAGARAFVLKEAAESELVAAILAATHGDRYLNPRLGARIASKRANDGASPDRLTNRERDVLKRLAAGHTNLEIARQLYLAARTVEAHRARLQRKLGLATRAELVAYAREHGLFPSAGRDCPAGT